MKNTAGNRDQNMGARLRNSRNAYGESGCGQKQHAPLRLREPLVYVAVAIPTSCGGTRQSQSMSNHWSCFHLCIYSPHWGHSSISTVWEGFYCCLPGSSLCDLSHIGLLIKPDLWFGKVAVLMGQIINMISYLLSLRVDWFSHTWNSNVFLNFDSF